LSTLGKGLTILTIILLAGIGLVVWKAKYGAHKDEGITHLTKEDMEILLKDANPMMLKRLAEDPEMKKKQVENIREFLAIASQARKSGLAKDEAVKSELEDVRAEVLAVNYDREKNKDKGQGPPFASVTKEEVDAFYQTAGNEAKFEQFIKRKIEEAKKEGKLTKDPTEEELAQVKDLYAKVRIYAKEAEEKAAGLGEDYNRQVELQVKLQQSQYLTRLYAEKVLAEKVKATDEEVQKYIAEHPEFDPKDKKSKAEEILQRAKGGEDFTKLAREFSEDPGSKEKGGLYESVKTGQMLPEFEQAALALEPGQIAPNPVETQYGYHIIKLEKKGAAKDETGQEVPSYDVRHILISTTFSDPESPFSQPVSLMEKIKAEIEGEKEKKVLADIVARNPIEIAEDFEVKVPEMPEQPAITPEMMEQLQRQSKNGAPLDGETKKPAAKKNTKK